MKTKISALFAGLMLLGAGVGWAEDSNAPTNGAFTDLSLEELVNIKVTSVSKKEEDLNDAAAAITVLSNEDIRRSGATSVAEALRMVPGLNVARVDANKWRSAREVSTADMPTACSCSWMGAAFIRRCLAVFIGTRRTQCWMILTGSKSFEARGSLSGAPMRSTA